MATKSLKLAFLILSALMVAQLIEAGRQPTAAIPANPKDPQIVEMGKYAVKENDNAALTFITVVKAETEAGSGMTNYRMVISAKDATTGKINNYNAVVSHSSGDLPQLVAFDRAADQRRLGGYVVIPPPYPKVVTDATAYAIAEHNRRTKSHLVLVQINKAEKQVVRGYNYRMNITAKESGVVIGGRTGIYVTVVNQFQQVFDLISFEGLYS